MSKSMTNDMAVNDIPCKYRQLHDGTFKVEFWHGQRDEKKAQQLILGETAKLTYCDHESFGIVSEIVWNSRGYTYEY